MNKKKKILLLSDDLRMASGIATMSKALVIGTVDKYDWFQVGAAINHPEKGKILDVSADVAAQTGVADASVKILPWTGYGDAGLLRQLINTEQPDAILHFTDPRYWIWLYEMEHELRQNIPIMFYAIWDDLPDPLYNRNYYESCDWIGCISRQTYGIVSRLTALTDKPTWKPHSDWQVSYVPHGINSNEYFPTEVPVEFRKEVLGDNEYDFVFFWSNRNIRRKQASDVIMAFKQFCDNLGEEKAAKVCLLMHTQPVDDNGTDLPTVYKTLAPKCNIIFSDKRRSTTELNYLYNIAVTTAESVMAGTPIIVNVTGGLQDQCGFRYKESGELVTAEDYIKIGSLHNWRDWESKVESGPWARPVWSRAQTMAGSVPTPYIWDDKVDIYEVAEAMMDMYIIPTETLASNGLKGRESFTGEIGLSSENMCKTFVAGIDGTFDNWKPRKAYELFKLN